MIFFFLFEFGCTPLTIFQKNLQQTLQKNEFSHHVYQTEDTHFSYWVKTTGTKPPIILIHGFGGSAAWTWSKSLDVIAKDRPVLLPDLLWFGESYSSLEPSLTTQANTLFAVLQQLKWSGFDVVGTSYGGFVALELSRMVPEPIDTLVLVDSPGPVFSPRDVEDLNKRFSMSHPSVLFVPEKPDGIQDLLDICSHRRKLRVPKAILEEVWRKTSFSKYHEEKKKLLIDLISSQEQYLEYSWNVDYVIWGEFDQIFPLSEARELVEKTGANLSIIPKTAHCPFVEKPKEFQQILLPILDRKR